MGLKKRSKVSAEFSMSSLTDIIFLLLIFFMLTSSLVAPNSLNLKLPGSSNVKVSTSKRIDDVRISSSGRFYLNDSRKSLSELEQNLTLLAKRKGSGKLDITISPDKGATVENVVAVMDIAMRLKINAILAGEE